MAKKTKMITAQQAKKAADDYLDDPKTIKYYLSDVIQHIENAMKFGRYDVNTFIGTQYKKIIDAMESELVAAGYTVRITDAGHPMTAFTSIHVSWGDPNETHD